MIRIIWVYNHRSCHGTKQQLVGNQIHNELIRSIPHLSESEQIQRSTPFHGEF